MTVFIRFENKQIMPTSPENHIESSPTPKVHFEFSLESEVDRVTYTLHKNEWFQEQGYNPKYPKAIQEKLDKGDDINEKDILEATRDEFDNEKYSARKSEIESEWKGVRDSFFDNLSTLDLPIQENYYVSATKYGVGGSYGYPNNIQLNLKQRGEITIAHEIVHLTIEPLIKEFNIEHWTKERLVDLIMSEFFPDDTWLQRDPGHSEEIADIFKKEFPNIRKIIESISNLSHE